MPVGDDIKKGPGRVQVEVVRRINKSKISKEDKKWG